MGKFIEKFYYGNLDPQVLMLNEDYLTENLSGESKKRLSSLCRRFAICD